MQPIDPEKTPKVHIPALNHIGLWIDNLEYCVSIFYFICVYVYLDVDTYLYYLITFIIAHL